MPQMANSGEPLVRLGCFLVVFAAVGLWEAVAPRRAARIARKQRWPGNIGIVVLDTLTVRLLFPVTAVGIALLAQARGWGLLSILPMQGWGAIVVAVLLLDLAIYGQHVTFHAVPILWRLHRMHHSDLEFDVTTGLRFHPVEILLSMVIKFAAIIAAGAPPLAVLIFEVTLNATSMFNHGNIHLPSQLDTMLRWFVVTPEMHRVHHSILWQETNSNFGFNLPWWDWLFGTYRVQPAAGHERMTVGVEKFRDPAELRIDRMLLQPLRDA
jgi:sterol desaturase/sphingolipid hydroxylase (fatty acid hydroxylase superfamily)